MLNISVHNLDSSCPVEKMPESIEIDLNGLDLHGSIHLSELKLPEGVVPTHPERDEVLANVVAPTIMKEVEEEITTEEGGGEGSEDESSSE